jgi:hypothetical protein
VTVLTLLALAACGAPPSSPATSGASDQAAVAAEGPEERVKGFFNTFSEAINDPQINEEAVKAEWTERLAAYAVPDEQESARTSIAATLGQFTGLDMAAMTGQNDLDVRMDVRFNITETRLVEESGDSATVEIVDGTIVMKAVGDDVEQLGDAAAAFNQELPIGDFFAQSGNTSNQIELERIDGVWYLVDALGTGA